MGSRSSVSAKLTSQGEDLAEINKRLPVRCSSCSKGRPEVLAMFEAPSAFICNKCVMLFAAEVAERRDGD